MTDELQVKASIKIETPAYLPIGIGGSLEVSRSFALNVKQNATQESAQDNSWWSSLIQSLSQSQDPALANNAKLEQTLIDNLIERAKLFPPPNVAPYKVDSFWRSLDEQPRITAIVSGKGGVGKSTIALGLTEVFSTDDSVLLIDFDLHNRGLTSKYGRLHDDTTTVLSSLRRFREGVLKSPKLKREAGQLSLANIDRATFHELRESFAFDQAHTLSPLNLEFLYQEKIRNFAFAGSVRPKKCFFMPSRRPGDLFLGTEESRLDAAEIALFITFLAHRARSNRDPISRIVLDCHGAHDMFMVGAILAAQHMVIVSKPEESAFEGTIELVRFTQSLVQAQDVFPIARSLVFNEVRLSDRLIAKALYQLYYDRTTPDDCFESVPTISTSDVLRDALKFYDKPCLYRNPEIAAALGRIAADGAQPA